MCMGELDSIELIKSKLVEIASHENRPEIIFVEIDSSVSDIKEEGMVPFLNIYGYNLFENSNFDEAINTAEENDDFGYITDILRHVARSDFEIKIVALFADFTDPNQQDGEDTIIKIIQDMVDSSSAVFANVKRLYFHYVDDYEFVKIINLPL